MNFSQNGKCKSSQSPLVFNNKSIFYKNKWAKQVVAKCVGAGMMRTFAIGPYFFEK